MKIALFCPHYGYITRGIEITVPELIKRLPFDIHIFGIGQTSDVQIKSLTKDKGLGKLSSQFAENTMIGGFLKRYIGITPHLEDITFAMNTLNKLQHDKIKYDLLWSHGEYWMANMCQKIRNQYNIPFMLSFHGPISKMLELEAKMLPDCLIVLTKEMEEWVKKKVPKCNVVQINHGVDIGFFNPKTISIYFINLQIQNYIDENMKQDNISIHPIVLSTSALIPSKNIDIIIKAMKKLGKGTLIVTNTGPIKNKIIKLGNKLLGNRFLYLERIPFNQLPNLYRFVDVFVLASKNEPFGTVLLESMACNTPVICQRDKTHEWMIGKGGVLLDDINICTLTTTLQSFIFDNAIQSDFKDEPRKQAEKFSWEVTAKGYENEILKVVQDRHI